ncbi:uncharacterized protein LOC135226378 [Macrobrachium nipponense]|uniref:uncharacterized protein LOC135226378 n=1 Tax=Macrobrachium nipponense TaxID=159736 RepID=UPI0030C8542A
MGRTPMMSLSSCVILLMLVSNSYAKSLIVNDVPDPPKKSSFRPPLARTAPFARQYFAKKRQESVDENTPATNALKETKRPPFSAVYELSVKIGNAPQPLPVIKFQSLVRYDHPQEDKTSSQREEHGGERIIFPDQVKDDTLKLLDEAATTGVSTIISTKVPILTTTEATTVKPTVTVTQIPTTTVTAELTTTTSTSTTTTTTTTKPTTEDPWEAFCNEACQEGLAGPECDCAEHPIG